MVQKREKLGDLKIYLFNEGKIKIISDNQKLNKSTVHRQYQDLSKKEFGQKEDDTRWKSVIYTGIMSIQRVMELCGTG